MALLPVSIRTISPIYVPIELKTGVDRSSARYTEFQRLIKGDFNTVRLSMLEDKSTEYESIEEDSWEHRLFIWENKQLDNTLEIHVFPNNIGVVTINHTFEYEGDAKAIEKVAQEKATQQIKAIHHEFLKDLDEICALKYGDYFKFNPTLVNELKIFWVSRALLMSTAEIDSPSLNGLVTNWLKHTYRPDDAKDILEGHRSYSMTWLNYVIVNLNELADERLDSMILAQYYYSAQENCNKQLKQAVEVAYNGTNSQDAQQMLARSRVTSRLHQVDYHEHLKYLTRSKRKILEEILSCWNYDQVTANGQRMIDICSSKIEETENAKREKSSLLTDLLLVALSFFTVFELSLYLTELSREMMSRPTLDFNDEDRSFMLQFIAEIDTDIMFGAGFFLTLLLVVIYKIIKSR